jgi:hypothetical protein
MRMYHHCYMRSSIIARNAVLATDVAGRAKMAVPVAAATVGVKLTSLSAASAAFAIVAGTDAPWPELRQAPAAYSLPRLYIGWPVCAVLHLFLEHNYKLLNLAVQRGRLQ